MLKGSKLLGGNLMNRISELRAFRPELAVVFMAFVLNWCARRYNWDRWGVIMSQVKE